MNCLGEILEDVRATNKRTTLAKQMAATYKLSIVKNIWVTGNVKLRKLTSAYKTACERTGVLISP